MFAKRCPWNPNKGYRMTFGEFVNYYILSDEYLKTDSANNDFWRTQTDNCNLCSIKYTFVGKVNTFSTDIRTWNTDLTVTHHEMIRIFTLGSSPSDKWRQRAYER